MPILLFGIGAFALFAGLAMVGFGIPINEFSFGNTLISAGTTAVVGGLIIIGLGVLAGQLRRVAEALSVQSPARFGQPMEAFENPAGARSTIPQGRVPFPPRPKSESDLASHVAAAGPDDDQPAQTFVPTLRNPDERSVTVEDDVSLSPHQPGAPASPAAASPFGSNGSGIGDKSRESMAGWRSPPPPVLSGPPPQARPLHTANFDAMWPAEGKLPKMGYTLYVDGSIEAELPQGTLHFASINELRNHLGKSS